MKIHLALFSLTALTLFAAGLFVAGLDPFLPGLWTFDGIGKALSYALMLLAILSAHEAGHYIAARRRGVSVSPPYFLPGIGPIPGLGLIPFFGTFGAFIKMEWERIRAVDLIAVAGWGPLAGFLLTLPAVFIGVALSEPVFLEDEGALLLGDPLLVRMATELFHPGMEEGMELMLHPLGLAGWVGCLLTALNLLPLGQLDGGHLLYGVFGERSRLAAMAMLTAMVLMGLFLFPGWLVLALLVVWMGPVHPSMLEGPPAKSGERWMVGLCALIFVLTFTPTPVLVDALPQWLGWM